MTKEESMELLRTLALKFQKIHSLEIKMNHSTNGVLIFYCQWLLAKLEANERSK